MKTALVTGATSGIGREIAKSLSSDGYRVLAHGRDPEKLRGTCIEIGAEPVLADLSLLTETRRLAAEVLSMVSKLDVLVLNAGTITKKREITSEGIERMFAVNHLAPFVLTQRLHPIIPGGGRVLNISTVAHTWINSLDLENLQAQRKFRVLRHYAATKSANLLAALEWNRRLTPDGVQVTAHHPGDVATAFGLHGPWWLRLFWKYAAKGRFISPAEAAAPIIEFLTTESVPVSFYYSLGKPESPAPHIFDQQTSRKVWDLSENLSSSEPPGPEIQPTLVRRRG